MITSADDNNNAPEPFLGRSIFTLLDSSILHYALERLHARMTLDDNEPVKFVTTTIQGLSLRGRVVPVLNIQRNMTGFILTLEDITETTRQQQQRDA